MPRSAPSPSLDEVRHALSSLALTVPADLFTNLSSFAEVACTLAEEIDHTHAFTYDVTAPSSASAASAVSLAVSRGYTGAPSDRAAVLDFLAADAQAVRLSTHAGVAAARARALEGCLGDSAVDASREDAAAAAAVSRMCRALGERVDGAEGVETAAEFAELAEGVVRRVAEKIEAGGGLEALGGVAVGEETVRAFEEEEGELRMEAEAIRDMLAAEHELRKGLLLRRLEVTVRSFGYSEKAGEDGFEGVMRGVRRAVERDEREVSVLDALVARDWVLETERVSGRDGVGEDGCEVKTMLMGSVPDRGGRVGAAAALKANMPAFRARQSGDGGGRGPGRGPGRGGKGRKGRKG